MKIPITILLASFTLVVCAEEEYVLTIDGRDTALSLGAEKTVSFKDGQEVKVLLKKKDIVTFEARRFSFAHKSSMAPQRTDLGDGIHQTLLSSSIGTAVIIQEYDDLNPTSLVDVMVKKM